MLDFSFKATAAERPYNPAILVKYRFGPEFLGAGPLYPRNNAQRHGPLIPRRFRQSLEDDVFHQRFNPRRLSLQWQPASGWSIQPKAAGPALRRLEQN